MVGGRSSGVPCSDYHNVTLLWESLARAMIIQDVGLCPPEWHSPIWDRKVIVRHVAKLCFWFNTSWKLRVSIWYMILIQSAVAGERLSISTGNILLLINQQVPRTDNMTLDC